MINASAAGDQVWIAGGTYKPSTTGLTDTRTAAFSLKNGVSVVGGFIGTAGSEGSMSTRTAMPSSTTLSGDIGSAGATSDNCYHVVNNDSNGLNSSAVIDGVVISSGNANESSSANANFGGGMFNLQSSPTIKNCLFTRNYADYGGGLCNGTTSAIQVTNCYFLNNSSATIGALYESAVTNSAITNCHFEQNQSAATGAAYTAANSATSTLTNCTFRDNQRSTFTQTSTINLVNCLLWNNGGQSAVSGGNTTVSYSLLETGITGYTDNGHNQPLISSPFDNTTDPALKACAPAVDAGSDAANATTTDVLGNARKVRTIDIGAAEFQGTPTQPITITRQPGSGSSVCVGTSVSVAVSVSGTSPTYQWYKDGQPLSNQLSATLTLSNVQTSQSGSYLLVVTSACNSVTSTAFSLTVNAPFSVNLGNDGSLTCVKKSVLLTTTGGPSGANYTYSPGAQASSTSSATATVTTSGPYSVTVTVPGGCSATATTIVSSNTVVPNVSTSPPAQTICQGQTASFMAQGADAYQWSTNATTATISVSVAGPYSVTGTATTSGCSATATASLSVNPLPMVYNVTGGGAYCAGGSGVAITLSGSQTGVNYQLLRDGSSVGSAVAGTGGGLTVGNQTTAGTYTVRASNATSNCQQMMSGSATVSVNPLPTAYNVTGGGAYCAGGSGVGVGLSASQTGVNYQLLLNGNAVGNPVTGMGNSFSFGNQTTAGTYTVLATDATTTCQQTMSGSAVVIVNALPTAYTVIGGGAYCTGGSGVAVTLSGSQTGVNYQLLRDGNLVGSAVTGTGSGLGFGNQTAAGTYTVRATNTSTACQQPMTGSVTVSVNPLPMVYTVSGGGAYCQGGSGVTVGLSSSQTGINYQLRRDGSPVGNPVTGTGNSFSFGNQTTAGTYTVLATDATTACQQTMSGSASVTVNSLPTQFSVTGGGAYCQGGSGVAVTLSGSQTGVNYQLLRDGNPVGSAVTGTGSPLSFSNQTAAGTYTVQATNTSTACQQPMTGSATVTVNPLPMVYNVIGGGAYCAGSNGIAVGLSSSQTGITYQLRRDDANVGNPVAGTGSALGFGNQTQAGTYTVLATNATTSCQQMMSGSAVVTITPLPSAPSLVTASGYPYPAGQSNLTISQNVGPVSLTASGCSGGMLTANGNAASSFTVSTANTGTQTYTATCTQNGCTGPAAGFQLTVVSTTLSVLHRDADYGQLTNNSIKPYLELANAGGNAIPYGDITVRYWFTSEGNAPPTNLAVYYAQLGAVNMNYVALATPRQGAYGYVEYSFPGGGSLSGGGNSGPIENGIQKTDGSNFDESDDYSYQAIYQDYMSNVHVTAYRNGTIVWGQEPTLGASQTTVQVYSSAKDGPTTSQIQTRLELRNTGNVALPVSNLKLRYYFTSDNGQLANVYVDYADIGASNVAASVVKLASPVGGADSYVELSFPGNSMQVNALSSLGAIDFRLVRSDYGLFDQSNDYSYAPNYGNVGLNNRVTAYVNNTLLFGTPPVVGARAVKLEAGSLLSAKVLGNPVVGSTALVEITGVAGQAVQLRLVDLQGRFLYEQRIEQAGETEQVSLPLGSSRGTLLLKVSTDTQHQSLKLLRP